jgi:hypothetical protein
MTLICRLNNLKERKMRKNKKKSINIKQDSSSLNQSLDCPLMNSQTFDVQDLLLTDNTDSVKAVFNSSFDDNNQDEQDKQEGNKGSNEEATMVFDVSCVDTSSARKHSSDGNEAAKGSAPKCARKSKKEGEKKKGIIVEEEEEEGRKEGRKKDDDDEDSERMGDKDERLVGVCKFCGLDRCVKKDLGAFYTAHFYRYLHLCKKGEANYEDAIERFQEAYFWALSFMEFLKQCKVDVKMERIMTPCIIRGSYDHLGVYFHNLNKIKEKEAQVCKDVTSFTGMREVMFQDRANDELQPHLEREIEEEEEAAKEAEDNNDKMKLTW